MIKRYQQQIILPEIGEEGQVMISNSSVLIVGAGGLGVVVASYLGSMGVGNIGICDFDKIEASNLHRQFCYTPNEIGQYKASVLTQKILLQNPDVKVNGLIVKVDENNFHGIAEKYQIICDCTDQSECRILINNYCKEYLKPLIHGAVTDWQGYLTVFHHKKKFGLGDLFDFKEYFNSQACSIIGVNPAICGMIGSHMVNEVVKIILGLDKVLEGELLYFNSLNNLVRTIKLKTAII